MDPRDRPEQLFTLVHLGHASVSEGAPLNSSDSKMFALFMTQSLRAGDGCSSSTGTLLPPLWLDSGATHHMLIPKHIKEKIAAAFTKESVSEGAPLNSSDSKMFALFITQSLRAGDGCSSSTGTLLPPLWLDSGATHHMVSDSTILINLRNPPPETLVAVADGSEYPVTMVGDIHTEYIKIKDVNVVPGLKMCVVSVRKLAESNIFTTFYKNHAELWLEGTRIGGAIIDGAALLYELHFLQAP